MRMLTVIQEMEVGIRFWKIALPRIEKFGVNAVTFLKPTTEFFLHSTMLEKSSGPWKETFYIRKAGKVFKSLE